MQSCSKLNISQFLLLVSTSSAFQGITFHALVDNKEIVFWLGQMHKFVSTAVIINPKSEITFFS